LSNITAIVLPPAAYLQSQWHRVRKGSAIKTATESSATFVNENENCQ